MTIFSNLFLIISLLRGVVGILPTNSCLVVLQ